MDRILLHDIRLTVYLGVPAAERSRTQEVFLDADIGFDTRPAGLSDDYHLTIDYAAVLRTIHRVAMAHPYALLEAMVERIAAAILDEFPAEEVTLRLRKPAALKDEGVGYAAVQIVRRRDG